jgi:hypothetical protein
MSDVEASEDEAWLSVLELLDELELLVELDDVDDESELLLPPHPASPTTIDVVRSNANIFFFI